MNCPICGCTLHYVVVVWVCNRNESRNDESKLELTVDAGRLLVVVGPAPGGEGVGAGGDVIIAAQTTERGSPEKREGAAVECRQGVAPLLALENIYGRGKGEGKKGWENEEEREEEKVGKARD